MEHPQTARSSTDARPLLSLAQFYFQRSLSRTQIVPTRYIWGCLIDPYGEKHQTLIRTGCLLVAAYHISAVPGYSLSPKYEVPVMVWTACGKGNASRSSDMANGLHLGQGQGSPPDLGATLQLGRG